MDHDLKLKQITDEDMAFLFEVYASTRAGEMQQTGWNEAEIKDFLTMQFNLQHHHYQKYYPDAKLDVILVDDKPSGRLYVDRTPKDLRIMDIALLPEYKGRGIGYYYMRQLMDEATEKKLPVSLHVEKNNPSLKFYDRLGFVSKEDRDVYLFLEWLPE